MADLSPPRLAGPLVACVLVLAGCGGGSGTDVNETPSATAKPKTSKTTARPTPVAQTAGTPAPEALAGFRCEQGGTSKKSADQKGQDQKKSAWSASGTIANATKAAASFQVTVHIGEIDGDGEHAARTVRLPNIAAGGSVPFSIEKVPTEGGDTCHVQVLRLP